MHARITLTTGILFTVFIQRIGVGPVGCYSESDSEARGGAVMFGGGTVYCGNTYVGAESFFFNNFFTSFMTFSFCKSALLDLQVSWNPCLQIPQRVRIVPLSLYVKN